MGFGLNLQMQSSADYEHGINVWHNETILKWQKKRGTKELGQNFAKCKSHNEILLSEQKSFKNSAQLWKNLHCLIFKVVKVAACWQKCFIGSKHIGYRFTKMSRTKKINATKKGRSLACNINFLNLQKVEWGVWYFVS